MSERTEQELRELSQRAARAIGKMPNVHSVGIGGREKAGRPTGELVVKVFVSKKRPNADLAPSERIPAQFEGLGTDVVECPRFVPDQAPQHPPGAPAGVFRDLERYRPLRGGVRLECANHSGFGTLGFIAQQVGGNRIFAVTNYHVLFDATHPETADIRVGQPSDSPSLTGCCSGEFGTFRFGHHDLLVDAVVIELDSGTEYLAEVEEIGLLTGMHTITSQEAATLTYQVRKRGERTRLTGGTVQAINVVDSTGNDPDDRAYLNGIRIRPNPDPNNAARFVRWSNHGDSGSAVVNDAREVVGLHFARSGEAGQVGWGTAFPIADAFDAFRTQNSLNLAVAVATQAGVPLRATGAPAAAPAARTDRPAVAPELEAELSGTAEGRLMTSLWLRHSREAYDLINSNRRAATLWHANHGPTVVNSLLRSRIDRRTPLPRELDGKDVDLCIQNILDALARYGSDDLRDGVRLWRSHLPRLAGRSYDDIVQELGAGIVTGASVGGTAGTT
jgi:hypothetical protein